MKKQKSVRARSGNPAKQRHKPLPARLPDTTLRATTLLSPITSKPSSKPVTRNRPNGVKRGAATALLPQLTREDRQSLLMLLAPFLIVASSLAGQQMLRTTPAMLPEIAAPRMPVAPPTQIAPPTQMATVPTPVAVSPIPNELTMPVPPPAALAPTTPAPSAAPAPRATAALRRGEPPALQPAAPQLSARERAERFAALKPTVRLEPLASEMLRPVLPPVIAARPAPAPIDPVIAAPPFSAPVQLPPLASLAPIPQPALPVPAVAAPVMPPAPLVVPASASPLVPPPASRPSQICEASPAIFSGRQTAHLRSFAEKPGQFGLALAAAAYEQLGDLVIYNARYARLSYPMGDVASLYGVCTDVVVRAYRSLGIDLQELIFTTKSGRGDIHIDHRRVEVVRKFLEKHGETLPISDFAEDFKPGDIVTYYRPQNRTSTSHIAVVSDRVAPSGRLMIIHNRGWGPQLEDALFVDKMTGHYRFSGLRPGKTPVNAALQRDSKDAARINLPAEQTLWVHASMSRWDAPLDQPALNARPVRHAAARDLCLPQATSSTAELQLMPSRPIPPAKTKSIPTKTAAAVIPVR